MKKERGITLVALTVTIIVLVILVGVSITTIINKGLITNSKNAVSRTKIESAKEKVKIEMDNLIIELINAGEPLTVEKVAEHFGTLSWIKSADIEEQNMVILVTEDNVAISIKINEGQSYEINEFVIRNTVTILTISSGDLGNLDWYKSNVVVNITTKQDSEVEIDKIAYTVEGAQTVEETIGNTVTITENGISTIQVWIYDKAGNKTKDEKLTIKKDSTGPTFTKLDTLTVTSYTEDTFKEGVELVDNESGVESYDYTPKTLTLGATNTITYTAKDKAGNETTKTRTIIYEELKYLVDLVSVGDYVAYDAGVWETTVAAPTKTGNVADNAKIGGYTKGVNKADNTMGYKGWQVLTKSGSGENGTVTLICAGCSATAYYYCGDWFTNPDRGAKARFQTAIDEFAKTNFIDNNFAESAGLVDYTYCKNNGLLFTNSTYKLTNYAGKWWVLNYPASEGDSYADLRCHYQDGANIYEAGFTGSDPRGIRPIVYLKKGVKTNKTKNTSFLGQTCWSLKW